jgi:hypothetical protein
MVWPSIPSGKFIFGCATGAQPEYMKALLGVVPYHFPAILRGYELGVQEYNDIPKPVRKILDNNWPKGEFKSYYVRESSDSDNEILGVAWFMRHEQIAVIDDWEFEGLWFDRNPVELVLKDGSRLLSGMDTYILKPQYRGHVIRSDLANKKPYLVEKKKFLELARKNNLFARRARGEK